MKKLWKAMKIAATILMLAAIFWAMLPFTMGAVGIGSLLPIGVFGCVLAYWYCPGLKGWVCGSAFGRGAVHALSLLLLVGLLVSTIFGLFILCNMQADPPEEKVTLVVLGCQVNGESPSRALLTRLEAARDFLTAYPDTPCILSGGQGEGERLSEAEVMYRWLVQQGIDDSRLYLEAQSTSTAENLVFSKAVAEQEGLPLQFVLATSEFHLYRSRQMAAALGLRTYSCPARTPGHLFFSQFVREILAVAKYKWIG